MSTTDHQRVAEVFLRACRADPDARAAVLEKACGDDDALRAEVESLLEHHDNPDSPIDEPMVAEIGIGSRPEIHEHPETIGGYRILRVLGEGGMGVVYLAEQERPRRTVALKVVRPGITSRQMLRRFEHETQVLGRLHHPGIGQIYEAGNAGTERSPQPFFAMEYIEGPTLTEHAERAGLSIPDRLELLARVCDAVQHAHSKGVIHRDLKPANILVQPDGQPKILDFGVARATDADIQATTMLTGVGQLVGTLPYMSPEQVSGNPDDIDMRCDVYSLGVVAYELLSGRLPHDLSTHSVADAARIIRDEDPPTLGSMSRAWRGDLDTIVAKALEKDKERRYQSPAELAADIRRHLHHEPIVARPPSTFYQLRKMVVRHKFPFAAAALLFVLVTAFAVVATIQAGRIANQRDRALEAEARAQERFDDVRSLANTFIFDVHERIRELPGSTETRRFIVSTALDYLDGLAEEAGDDPDLQFDIARGYLRVGDALGALNTRNLGDLEGADRNYRLAAGMLDDLLNADPGSPDLRLQWQRARSRIGTVHYQRKEYDEAARRFDEAARACLALIEEAPDDLRTLHDLNILAHYQALILAERGEREEAIERYREILPRTDRMLEIDPQSDAARQDRGLALNEIGSLLVSLDRADEALEHYREALAMRRAVARKNPTNAPDQAIVTNSLIDLGDVLWGRDQAEEALALFREALEIRRALAAADPYDLDAVKNLALCHERVAGALSSLGRNDEAYAEYEKMLELRERHARQDPTNLRVLRELTVAYEKMGNMALQADSFDETADWYGKALDIRADIASRGEPTTQALRDLSVSHFKMGDLYGQAAQEGDGTVDEKRIYAEKSRAGYARALEIVLDMKAQGLMLPSDAHIPDFIRGRIEECEQFLAGLETAGAETATGEASGG